MYYLTVTHFMPISHAQEGSVIAIYGDVLDVIQHSGHKMVTTWSKHDHDVIIGR
jgi:hypothetical protein